MRTKNLGEGLRNAPNFCVCFLFFFSFNLCAWCFALFVNKMLSTIHVYFPKALKNFYSDLPSRRTPVLLAKFSGTWRAAPVQFRKVFEIFEMPSVQKTRMTVIELVYRHVFFDCGLDIRFSKLLTF